MPEYKSADHEPQKSRRNPCDAYYWEPLQHRQDEYKKYYGGDNGNPYHDEKRKKKKEAEPMTLTVKPKPKPRPVDIGFSVPLSQR